MEIIHLEKLDDDLTKLIVKGFEAQSLKKGIDTNYNPFAFVAKEGADVLGICYGNTAFDEIYIDTLIITEGHRNKKIGTKLINEVEMYFRNKGYLQINLSTMGFQAKGFYEKMGYTLEYTRVHKSNPKLTRYFMIKYY